MKNIRITKAAILAMGVLCVVMVVTAPHIVGYVMRCPAALTDGLLRYGLMLGFGYILAGCAFTCLISLFRMISRIEKDEVFVRENVKSLGNIAVEVGLAAIVCFFLGITCLYLMLGVAVMAAFMVLIVLVVRSSFDRAVQMKDELDLTI